MVELFTITRFSLLDILGHMQCFLCNNHISDRISKTEIV